MESLFTTLELEQKLGEAIKNLRLQKNLTRETVCERSGISLTALRNLESGNGANTHSLIRVVRTLGRQDWIFALAPITTNKPVRQRASRRKKSL
ncbi:MAG: helix-turn-helix transcriptional regulator [Myxococcaceae bacterium]